MLVSSKLWRESRSACPAGHILELMLWFSKVNLHAMRMGPGKHLKGLELMDGIVKPEEVRGLLELSWPSLTIVSSSSSITSTRFAKPTMCSET